MISKSLIKYINSLKLAKFRDATHCFIAEGPKLVDEVLESDFTVEKLIYTQEWHDLSVKKLHKNTERLIASESELKKISSLSTPNKVLAVVRKPDYPLILDDIHDEPVLILDDIRDPGNLGTIMRLVDWFGIGNIYCSRESVDVYNPKVVQSTMGSICRVKVHYLDIIQLLHHIRNSYRIFGSDMAGKNIYHETLPGKSAIIIGNEANGISGHILELVDDKIMIPSFRKGAESLNASVATAIIVSEFSRNKL